ncbi:hypothetical protein [Streptomyces sp. NRRL S-1521]|uniref:hypothetical protein n=1 Tax=Streptomyces sp. NRRL S-1521 TaxID=1609100 RepID=UPI000748FC38|nr:hypothetical protein [Streptomyces sp. NRRL S-1521]KUL62452.1 hypothetical protein ADL30_05335 [Streptomyces sp. NRRL S-1521]
MNIKFFGVASGRAAGVPAERPTPASAPVPTPASAVPAVPADPADPADPAKQNGPVAKRRSRSTSKIKLAIAAFGVSAAATFGFIATGTEATTAVGISLSCTLAAERLVGMASSSRRPSDQGEHDGSRDEETEES